jgi:hypothetical protein
MNTIIKQNFQLFISNKYLESKISPREKVMALAKSNKKSISLPIIDHAEIQ